MPRKSLVLDAMHRDKPKTLRKLTDEERQKLWGGSCIVNNYFIDIFGLGVLPDGTMVVNDGMNSPLLFEGRPITLFNHTEFSMQFRPLVNPKLMNYLFNLYCTKIQVEDGRYIKAIEYNSDFDRKKANMLMIYEDGYDEPLTTDWYYNDTIRYIEAILRLNDTMPSIDLHELDMLLLRK